MLKRVALNIGTSPLRYIGAAQAQPRQMWTRTERINQFAGGVSVFSGTPYGHLHPSSWTLPLKPGALASRNEANIIFAANGNAAQGLAAQGSTNIVFEGAGNGQAVASAVGSASIVFQSSALGVAPINAAGNANILFTGSATLNAPASMASNTAISFTATAQTFANGFIIAAPISQELTPDQIATAVWSAVAAGNNAIGTMGEKLNDAGSAGNPWAALISENTTPETFGQVLQTMQTLVDELHKLQGLSVGNPMTVTPTSRAVGDISLTITGDGVTTTTVTRA